jgi:hypothetical protein
MCSCNACQACGWPERRVTATRIIFMGWRLFGRIGDSPGLSPLDDEPNRGQYFSELIVFNVLRAGKFSSSTFARAQPVGVAESAGRSAG